MKNILNFDKFKINEAAKSPERAEAEEKALSFILGELKKDGGLTRFEMTKAIENELGEGKINKNVARSTADKLMSDASMKEYGVESENRDGKVYWSIAGEVEPERNFEEEYDEEEEDAFSYFNIDPEDEEFARSAAEEDMGEEGFSDRNMNFRKDSRNQLGSKLKNPKYDKFTDDITDEIGQRPRPRRRK